MGPKASLGASICPAFATTTAVSQRPAAISAAARWKRICALAGCCFAWAVRVGISTGVTGLGRGPPAQATTRPLMPKSRDLRPANAGDSHSRRGVQDAGALGPRKSRAWYVVRDRWDPTHDTPRTDLPLSDRNRYDARHRRGPPAARR